MLEELNELLQGDDRIVIVPQVLQLLPEALHSNIGRGVFILPETMIDEHRHIAFCCRNTVNCFRS